VSGNGADQVVSRTIHGADGGIATVSVVVSIDQSAPEVTVTGIRNKTRYQAPGPAKVGCAAAESLSGLAAPCTLTVHRSATAIIWSATATSKAGVTTRVKGRAGLTDFYVAGAATQAGRYLVTVGRDYTITAYVPGAKTAPRYVYAAPDGITPHPAGQTMSQVSPGLWTIRAAITTTMDRRYEYWTLGILVGHTLHTIRITLQK
jgi:hypothetical protein